jgi:inosine-uridine nucleoside N-ribohydrolase
MKVWLDVDTGVDDAHAILLALRSPELDVLGISCVAGELSATTHLGPTSDHLILSCTPDHRKFYCRQSGGCDAEGV